MAYYNYSENGFFGCDFGVSYPHSDVMRRYLKEKWNHVDASYIRTKPFDELFNCNSPSHSLSNDMIAFASKNDVLAQEFLNFGPLPEEVVYELGKKHGYTSEDAFEIYDILFNILCSGKKQGRKRYWEGCLLIMIA